MPFFLVAGGALLRVWSVHRARAITAARAGRTRRGDPAVSARLRRFAGPAIIVLALTQTFASIDWIMSLTPHWYSTIFGVYFFAGSFVGFIALLSVVASAMRAAGLLDTRRSPPSTCTTSASSSSPSRLLGLHRLLPVLPHLVRQPARGDDLVQGAARGVLEGGVDPPDGGTLRRAVSLPDGPRGQAAGDGRLALGGAWLLAMHFVDLYWQVMPTLHPEGVRPSALDVAAFLAIGGCFVAAAALADAAAGARAGARPAARRIAGVRER